MLTLAWILAVGLTGPILAMPRRFRIPAAVGEILIGIIFGSSGLNVVPLKNVTLTLIADIGFALVMMVAGSHIAIARFAHRQILGVALGRQAIIFAVGLPFAYLIATVTHFHHTLIFFVLMTSSSAALIMPIFAQKEEGDSSNQIAIMLTQVTIADFLAIVALPLVMNPNHLLRVLAGAAIISISAFLFFALLHIADRTGYLMRIRNISKTNHFGLELRFSLIILLVLAGIALQFHISVMIAGFALGLALAANGMSHRLARQLFAVTEGFFAPIFFVWLGAKIDVRAAFTDFHLLMLAALLGVGAVLTHTATVILHQPLPLAVASSVQLGVPVAAVTIGQSTGLLTAGQGGAIMLAALITIIATLITTSRSTQ